MKLAVLSESSAEEAAIRILVDGILRRATQAISLRPFRPRAGWSSVERLLPSVLQYLHYQTDAEGLVVVLDSDDTPLHRLDHDPTGEDGVGCRYCTLTRIASQTPLASVVGRSPVRIAVGVAVPALEAWLRFGVDSEVSEAAWAVACQANKFAYDRKSLKCDLYGTDEPSLTVATQRMTEEAQRLVSRLHDLEVWFPIGFGLFAQEIRSW